MLGANVEALTNIIKLAADVGVEVEADIEAEDGVTPGSNEDELKSEHPVAINTKTAMVDNGPFIIDHQSSYVRQPQV